MLWMVWWSRGRTVRRVDGERYRVFLIMIFFPCPTKKYHIPSTRLPNPSTQERYSPTHQLANSPIIKKKGVWEIEI